MSQVPLFVELCAGTAALSLRLHRRHARPPVSRMGAKTGYADAILRVLGLAPGSGAARYLWCEPDAGVRLLLAAYRDADLARAAAAMIRSWADEEPRALWERLRAEGPVREAPDDARELARWAVLRVRTMPQATPGSHGDFLPMISPSGTTRYRLDTPADALALTPTLPARVEPDARTVDPREVARSYLLGAWSFRQSEPSSGFVASEAHDRPGCPGGRQSAKALSASVSGLASVPGHILPDARDLHPTAALPRGTVVYMDPPYVGTTGYASDLPRSEVVTLARRWHAAGARVCISEAEPIPELVADGWYAVRIDGERVGQKRTFSKQQAEWLTLSDPPAWRPSVQAGLFG